MKNEVSIGGRRSGKTLAMEKMRDEFFRKNPKATMVTVRGGETIVEKHVEELGPKLIGVDYGKGDMSAEIEGRMGPDGKLKIENIRTWEHELELKANKDT